MRTTPDNRQAGTVRLIRIWNVIGCTVPPSQILFLFPVASALQGNTVRIASVGSIQGAECNSVNRDDYRTAHSVLSGEMNLASAKRLAKQFLHLRRSIYAGRKAR